MIDNLYYNNLVPKLTIKEINKYIMEDIKNALLNHDKMESLSKKIILLYEDFYFYNHYYPYYEIKYFKSLFNENNMNKLVYSFTIKLKSSLLFSDIDIYLTKILNELYNEIFECLDRINP